jgi:hypothetical protein
MEKLYQAVSGKIRIIAYFVAVVVLAGSSRGAEYESLEVFGRPINGNYMRSPHCLLLNVINKSKSDVKVFTKDIYDMNLNCTVYDVTSGERLPVLPGGMLNKREQKYVIISGETMVQFLVPLCSHSVFVGSTEGVYRLHHAYFGDIATVKIKDGTMESVYLEDPQGDNLEPNKTQQAKPR